MVEVFGNYHYPGNCLPFNILFFPLNNNIHYIGSACDAVGPGDKST